jgi:hypothetical protein
LECTTYAVLSGLEGEQISGGEGHDEGEEKEYDLLHVVGCLWMKPKTRYSRINKAPPLA